MRTSAVRAYHGSTPAWAAAAGRHQDQVAGYVVVVRSLKYRFRWNAWWHSTGGRRRRDDASCWHGGWCCECRPSGALCMAPVSAVAHRRRWEGRRRQRRWRGRTRARCCPGPANRWLRCRALRGAGGAGGRGRCRGATVTRCEGGLLALGPRQPVNLLVHVAGRAEHAVGLAFQKRGFCVRKERLNDPLAVAAPIALGCRAHPGRSRHQHRHCAAP